jgi:DNA mismatch repair protein MutL
VHPRKAEVRFAQERSVYQAVSQAVSAALAPYPVEVERLLGTPGWPFPETPTAPGLLAEGDVSYELGRLSEAHRPEALGQVRNTYLVARTFDGLIVVDQHAAAEAVLAERLLSSSEARPLSPPVRLDLTTREAELLTMHLGLLSDLGIEVEPFGGNSFVARALPAPMLGRDVPELLAELVEELATSRTLQPDAVRERLAQKAACWAAIKAGDRLTPEQQQRLLDDLQATWSPSVCPHGRPVLFALSVQEMERRFLRR